MINSPELLNNPLGIQSVILTDFQQRLEGDLALVDANNSFAFLIESFSRITADSVVAMNKKLSGLYPIRANTTADLYNHLSDFDYVGFFSYPAPLKMSLMLHRDYLVKNAVKVPDTNYQMVVIPADTVFTIGRFNFGLYYPIQIRINTIIDTVAASYDTTDENPLKNLATNTIPVYSSTYGGVDLVSIQFECYQFNKVVTVESINPDIGFIKNYQYDDRFYAVRIFDTSTGTKKELAYTLSDSVYDVNKPTANLKILPETNEISISIPQIYFTSGLVGRQLQVELYTTMGELDVSLSNLQLSDVSANFAMSSPNTDLTYTNILKNIPTVILSPIDVRITGGSNSYTFTQMKDFTIYHNNALSVPITRMDLDRFFAKNGFTYMAKIDNLTDRRYYAYRKLRLGTDELGVTCGGLTVPYEEDGYNQGVIYHGNNTIVILPTVIYKYIKNINKFDILSDASADIIKNASGLRLANMLNDTGYFCNPHHVVITTLDRYPACDFYDLMTTTASNITFIEENAYLSAQLSLITVDIRHLGNGSGGYIIRAGMQRSDDLADTAPDDLNCFLTVTTVEGFIVGIRGVYIGKFNDLDVFDFTISTNYKLSSTALSVTNLGALNTAPVEYSIKLSGTMFVSTFVKKSLFPTVNQDDEVALYITDDDGSWLGVSLQSFDYILGSNLSDILDSNLLTNWTSIEYQLYDTDVPLLYVHDVYETNLNGTLVYSNDGAGNLTTHKLHSIGDPVLDSSGAPIIKYTTGDVVKDANGDPIQISSRMKDFTIDLSAYEYSRQLVTTDFLILLSADLAAYYSTIREMNNAILENTNIYFRPVITTGAGRYRIDNTTIIESSLELKFVFNCYVSQATLNSTVMIEAITTKIADITTSHLSDEIISLTLIAADIKSQLSTYINSIDVVSLNGDNYIQTLMNIDVDKSPKLGMKLAVGTDSRLAYVPEITINFNALDV